MNIKETKKNKVTVLVVEGRIDSTTSAELEKKLISLIETDGVKDIAMDFTAMDYISSAGLRVLLMAAKKAGKLGGKAVLAGLNANVKEVFDISGFSNILSIYTSQEEAVKAF
ncbi:MAG: STAS domain-containing protein [Clostridiaceae bacterium]|nr:STAS domain-containing protein [Clostridiaceae bacterium]